MKYTTLFLATSIALLIFAVGCTSSASADSPSEAVAAPSSFDAPPPVGTKVLCPVMNNEFTVVEDTQRSHYNGKHYAFCCSGCKPMFDADPGKYAN